MSDVRWPVLLFASCDRVVGPEDGGMRVQIDAGASITIERPNLVGLHEVVINNRRNKTRRALRRDDLPCLSTTVGLRQLPVAFPDDIEAFIRAAEVTHA